MITINLLSPDQKKELKLKTIYLAVKELVMLILLFTAIVAILLLVSRYYLEEQLNNLIRGNASALNITQAFNREVIAVNRRLDLVADIQKKFKSWSGLMIEIAKLTPANVSYSLIKAYHQESAVELKGVAKTRGDLIALENNLKKSVLFKNVSFPFNSLLAKENNAFDVRFELNLDQLP